MSSVYPETLVLDALYHFHQIRSWLKVLPSMETTKPDDGSHAREAL